jgi:hypothetical protein
VSYIDSFDHEFVGYFGGLPVYHPLEVVPASPDGHSLDFACGPDNLVIGGGSGEHPGLVIRQPGETVNSFVRAWLLRQQPDELRALRPAVEPWPDASGDRETGDYWQRVFEFAGWLAEDHAEFSQRCTSTTFHRPFRPEEGCLERWLAASVGEFILLAMPELAPDAIGRLGDLRRHVVGGLYANILLLPPGYPVWGRREVDQQLIWGVSAWQIRRAQHPLTRRGGSDTEG